jgi:hypothetical protein
MFYGMQDTLFHKIIMAEGSNHLQSIIFGIDVSSEDIARLNLLVCTVITIAQIRNRANYYYIANDMARNF